jgi:N-acetylglucosaminyldiphosphoundecaprenol N-acetyl-beta-D-mannosaminyltransferase
MNILGVKIDNINLIEAQTKVREFLISEKQYQIFTPNPEFLVQAQKDGYFKQILNSSDLNLPDGRGLQFVSRGKLKVIPGVDFILDICKIAENLQKSIYLLGSSSEEIVKQTAKKLQEKFPNLKIVGHNQGPKIVDHKNNKLIIENNDYLIQKINKARPDVLFVAFGMGKQEKWIYENLTGIPSVKIAMGVGGSFDFLSEKIKRAPKWIRTIWMEWMWRLIREPKRLPRIFNATVKFLFLYTKSIFKK